MIDEDELLSPEVKAAIFAEVIKLAALVPGPSRVIALEEKVRKHLALSEETVGAEIHSAIFLCARLGIFEVSTYKPDVMEITFGYDTELSPSKAVLSYLYSED